MTLPLHDPLAQDSLCSMFTLTREAYVSVVLFYSCCIYMVYKFVASPRKTLLYITQLRAIAHN